MAKRISILEMALNKCRDIPPVKHQQRIYAMIHDKRGRVIAEERNRYDVTHPTMKSFSMRSIKVEEKCYLHAEVAAIIKASKNINPKRKYQLTVARVDKSGKPMDAYPCEVCRLAIKETEWIESVSCSVG